jgi:hypothetical protein
MPKSPCPKCGRDTKVGENAKGEKVRYCVGCNLNVEYCGCEGEFERLMRLPCAPIIERIPPEPY